MGKDLTKLQKNIANIKKILKRGANFVRPKEEVKKPKLP